MKNVKRINLAERVLSDVDVEELIDKEELMLEEEYLERWFFDFLRANRKHCPIMLNDPYEEFGFLDKWPNVIPLMFPAPNTYVDSQYDQVYDIRGLKKMFPSYNAKNIHALGVIRDSCRKYYSVSEYVDIVNDINRLANKMGINTMPMIDLEDVNEISNYYAKDGKDVVDMINSQEIIISDDVDAFFEDLLEKNPDAVLSLDLTEEIHSLKDSYRITFRQLLLDFYIKHGEVVELRSGRYLFV